MTVSMDGLRNHLLSSYNSLTRKLNKNTRDKDSDPTIVIGVDSIENEMEGLRNCIVTLAYMYDDSEGGFKQLENPHFENFNPQPEEDGV
jgi:hypothetical protein